MEVGYCLTFSETILTFQIHNLHNSGGEGVDSKGSPLLLLKGTTWPQCLRRIPPPQSTLKGGGTGLKAVVGMPSTDMISFFFFEVKQAHLPVLPIKID